MTWRSAVASQDEWDREIWYWLDHCAHCGWPLCDNWPSDNPESHCDFCGWVCNNDDNCPSCAEISRLHRVQESISPHWSKLLEEVN